MTQTIHKQSVSVILSLALLLAVTCGNALAAGASTAEAAIDMALERNGGNGKVLSVRERDTDSGSSYFMIKILHNGKVRIFKVEKES